MYSKKIHRYYLDPSSKKFSKDKIMQEILFNIEVTLLLSTYC